MATATTCEVDAVAVFVEALAECRRAALALVEEVEDGSIQADHPADVAADLRALVGWGRGGVGRAAVGRAAQRAGSRGRRAANLLATWVRSGDDGRENRYVEMA